MINSLSNLMDEIVAVFVVSNTPAYLFKHLRRVIAEVAREESLPVVAAEVRSLISQPSESLDFKKEAYLYALFVLLTFQCDEADTDREIGLFRECGLVWAKEMVDLHKANAIAPTTSTFELQPSLVFTSSSVHQRST